MYHYIVYNWRARFKNIKGEERRGRFFILARDGGKMRAIASVHEIAPSD